MKKVLNIFGIFMSSVFSVVLFGLIIAFMVLVNIKSIVNKGGIKDILTKIDIVETIKENDNVMWGDFQELATDMKLTESQFEEMLQSEAVKGKIAGFISNAIESITNDSKFVVTEEELTNFVNLAIDEYNKVSDTKINEEKRKEIIASIDKEVLDEFNNAMDFSDLREELYGENKDAVVFINKVLFENALVLVFITMLIVVGLIALFRLSCYKWMFYTGISTLISGLLLFLSNILLSSIKLVDVEGNFIIDSIFDVVKSNLRGGAVILIIISVALFVVHAILKRLFKNKKIDNKEAVTEA